MHPADVWLTRMEMNLPLSALDADCAVTPAKAASTRSVFYGAQVVENPPCANATVTTAGSLAFALWCASGLVARRRTTRRRTTPRVSPG